MREKRKTNQSPNTQKVRRITAGGKRAAGWDLQKNCRQVRRPDPGKIRYGRPDPSLTVVSGLVPFGRHLREIGLDRELAQWFGQIKDGQGVVHPMGGQMRNLIDANVVGEPRIFGLESLAADPLFSRLAGGSVASIDTHNRDLKRFGPVDIFCLELLLARYGLRTKQLEQYKVVHLDIDTTVEPLFGNQQNAKPGHNPRYHSRPSYQARMGAIEDEGVHYVIKARLTKDLKLAIHDTKRWRTVEYDEYIEALYNHERLHSSLDHVSPVEYERNRRDEKAAA